MSKNKVKPSLQLKRLYKKEVEYNTYGVPTLSFKRWLSKHQKDNDVYQRWLENKMGLHRNTRSDVKLAKIKVEANATKAAKKAKKSG
jgi:hypothetical protein